tara:strand:+ start:3802 stop:4296 length:495 start_codon:yes stop_codon:yes gene_type:complete
MSETPTQNSMLSNIPYGSIAIGHTVSVEKTVSQREIILFAALSGDLNPIHLDRHYAASTDFGQPIAHGMLCGAFISATIATHLPGPGSIYRGQTIKFTQPVFACDTLTITLTVINKKDRLKLVTLACVVSNQDNNVVAKGEASVIASEEKVDIAASELPTITIN